MEPTPHAASHGYKAANKLQGKVALVTGGDSGIGRAVCYCFAMEGATVAFTYVDKPQEDRDAADTLQVLREIKKGSDAKDPMAIPAHPGFEENCRKVVEEVAGAYGRIDILVNNAADRAARQDLHHRHHRGAARARLPDQHLLLLPCNQVGGEAHEGRKQRHQHDVRLSHS